MDRSAHVSRAGVTGHSLLGRGRPSSPVAVASSTAVNRSGYGTSAHLVRVPSPRGHVLVPSGVSTQGSVGVVAAAHHGGGRSTSTVHEQYSDVQSRTSRTHHHQSQQSEDDGVAGVSMQDVSSIVALQRTIDTQRDQLKALNRDAAAAVAREDELRDEIKRLHTAQRLQTEDNMRRELSSLQAEIEERRKAVDTLEIANDASRQIAMLSEENAHLKQGMASLEERLQSSERCVRQLTDELQRTERLYAERQGDATKAHREQLEAYRELVEKKDEELREKSSVIGVIEKDLDGRHTTLLEASAHNKELQAYGQSIHDTLLRANTENARLQVENRSLKDELAEAVENLTKMGREWEVFQGETRRQMQGDISKIVDGAEKEIASLRRKISQYEVKTLKLKEKLLRSHGREEELRVRLQSATHITEADRKREARLHKEKEEELLQTSLQAQEELNLKLAQTENELFTTRAALAEAKTTALMQYFSERGSMEKDAAAKADILAEEIRSCNRLVRRILDRYTSRVDPPPGENDAKVVTLKQLLLLLQSHLTVVLEEPPPTDPTLLAWQERGRQLLHEQQQHHHHHQPLHDGRSPTPVVDPRQRTPGADEGTPVPQTRKPMIVAAPQAPFMSTITSRTVTTTLSNSESSS